MASASAFGITVCGIVELGQHVALGATHVLSILDPEYPVPEAFGQYGEHVRLERRFHDIIAPTPGLTPPGEVDITAVLALGKSLQEERAPRLLVHCHAGISRSTAAMALILAQAMPEVPAADILAMVHGIREKAWPNLRMIEMGDARLGRGGSLVEAAFGLYRLQLDRRPHIAEYMCGEGRAREVEGGRLRPALSL